MQSDRLHGILYTEKPGVGWTVHSQAGAPDSDTKDHPSCPKHENKINPTGRHFKAPSRTRASGLDSYLRK